jgi:hypothetical protein
MPAIEGYIGNCHPEKSTVDRGISLSQQWNSSKIYKLKVRPKYELINNLWINTKIYIVIRFVM